MSGYYPEPKSSGGRVKVELNLSNYATKADLKNAAGVDTSKCAKKIDLPNLKSKIKNIEDKIPDITNLATNASLNVKINEVKGERPSITNLATTTVLTVVENKNS